MQRPGLPRRRRRPTCLAQDRVWAGGAIRRPAAFIVAGPSVGPVRQAAAGLARELEARIGVRLPIVEPTGLAWSRLGQADALVLGSGAANAVALELQRRGLALAPGCLNGEEFFIRTLYDPCRTQTNVMLIEAGEPAGWAAAAAALLKAERDGLVDAPVLGVVPGLPAWQPTVPEGDRALAEAHGSWPRTAALAVGSGAMFYWTADDVWADLSLRAMDCLLAQVDSGLEAGAAWLGLVVDAWGWVQTSEAIEDERVAAVGEGLMALGRKASERLSAGAGDPVATAGMALLLLRLVEDGRHGPDWLDPDCRHCRTVAVQALGRLVDGWVQQGGPGVEEPVALWLAGLAGLAIGDLTLWESGLMGQAAEMGLDVHDPQGRLVVPGSAEGEGLPVAAAWLGLLRLAAWYHRDGEYHWTAEQIERAIQRRAGPAWPGALLDPVWAASAWTRLGSEAGPGGPNGRPASGRLSRGGRSAWPEAKTTMDRSGYVALRGEAVPTGEYLLLGADRTRGGQVLRLMDQGHVWVAGSSVAVVEGSRAGGLEAAVRPVVCQGVERLVHGEKLSIVRFTGTAGDDGAQADLWTWVRTVVWNKGQFTLFLDELGGPTDRPVALDLAWDLAQAGVGRSGRWIVSHEGAQFRIVPMGGGPMQAAEADEAADGVRQRLRQRWSWPAAHPEPLLAATLLVVQPGSQIRRWSLRRAGTAGVAVVGKNARVFVLLHGPRTADFATDAGLCYVDGQEVMLSEFREVRLGDFHMRSYLPLWLAMDLRDGAGEIYAPQSTTLRFVAPDPAGVSLDGQILWGRRHDPDQALVLTAGTHTFAARPLVGRRVRLADALRRA